MAEFKNYNDAVASGDIFVWSAGGDRLAKKERFDANTKFTVDNQVLLYAAVSKLVQDNQTVIQQNLQAIASLSGGVTANMETVYTKEQMDLFLGSLFKTDGSQKFAGNLIPSLADTFTLGSKEFPWKDLFVGNHSLYVGGQQVVSNDDGTIVISADVDQNVQLKTSGGGDIEFLPDGTGVIQLKGSVQIPSNKFLMTNDNMPLQVGNDLHVDGDIVLYKINGTSVDQLISDVAAMKIAMGSDTSALDNLQEVVDFITANRETLNALTITSIAGLTAALDNKANKDLSNVLSLPQAVQTQLKGDQGEKGDLGATGDQGIQGPKGDTGSQGNTGSIGPQGIKGEVGLTGPKGATGSQGNQGDTGSQGIQGIQGIKGDKGDTGSQGIQGIKGDKGDTGSQGIQGIKGDTGPQGIKGDTGSQGNTGATGQGFKIGKIFNSVSLLQSGSVTSGEFGLVAGTLSQDHDDYGKLYLREGSIWTYITDMSIKGASGVQGPKGDTGSQGIQGPKGDTGATGPQGIQGPTGPTGAKGNTGATGPTGPKGDTGSQGIQGIAGIDGIDGDSAISDKSTIMNFCLNATSSI